MIKIKNNTLDPNDIINAYPSGNIEAEITNKLSSSPKIYRYNSIEQLKFELNMRSKIINSSRELYKSKIKFRTFKESMCNTDYWERTEEGGFLLKQNVKPSDAIKDIFKNGPKYGTECATAMVIVYYKALLDIYSEELFNSTFTNIHLMDWKYIDRNLDINSYDDEENHFPGDCIYFENPDVNPERSEWQGENAIDLGDGKYYGHGIGIKTSDEIIAALNKNRKTDAAKSAFLTNSIANPNFKHLANIYLAYISRMRMEYYRGFYAL